MAVALPEPDATGGGDLRRFHVLLRGAVFLWLDVLVLVGASKWVSVAASYVLRRKGLPFSSSVRSKQSTLFLIGLGYVASTSLSLLSLLLLLSLSDITMVTEGGCLFETKNDEGEGVEIGSGPSKTRQ